MHGRWLGPLAAAICSLAMAAPAQASSEFITSKLGQEEVLKVRGASGTGGEQQLVLGPFTVSCRAARVSGSPGPGGHELRNETKLSGCTSAVTAGSEELPVPAKLKDPLVLGYDASTGGAELVNPVTVALPSLKCTISIEEGPLYYPPGGGVGAGAGKIPFVDISVPTRRLHDFPSGFQHILEVESFERGLSYSFGGACAGMPAGEEGEYLGTTAEEAVHGDLEFIPGAVWPEGWNIVKNKEG
jgi:hypothetical protein